MITIGRIVWYHNSKSLSIIIFFVTLNSSYCGNYKSDMHELYWWDGIICQSLMSGPLQNDNSWRMVTIFTIYISVGAGASPEYNYEPEKISPGLSGLTLKNCLWDEKYILITTDIFTAPQPAVHFCGYWVEKIYLMLVCSITILLI